jgi:integrase
MSRLAPKDVVGYLSKRAARLKPASAKVVASSIRSYFRFLRLHGECDEALTLAVPAPASRRLASLPKVLTDAEVRLLLAVFDRGTAAGRRDDQLPLTSLVGGAIAAYIRRGRPPTPERQIFLRVRPPIGQAAKCSTVRDAILRAATRAGMSSIVTGTQILRHASDRRPQNSRNSGVACLHAGRPSIRERRYRFFPLSDTPSPYPALPGPFPNTALKALTPSFLVSM